MKPSRRADGRSRTTSETDIAARAAVSTAPASPTSPPASASSTTCSTCSPTTAASTSRCGPTATSTSTATTRSRTSAWRSARRCARRSATSAASAATARAWCPWTRRWPWSRSTCPGRPFLAHDLELAGVRIGEFDADLDGALLPLARHAGGMHAARAPAGRQRRPPHRRGGVQGVRAGAARGLRASRTRRRRAVDQGHPLTVLRGPAMHGVAVVDYGMGNLASVAKALERARRRRARHRRPAARARRRRAWCCPASARSATPAARLAPAGSATPCSSASPPACRSSACASACSCCSSAATRAAGWPASASSPAGSSASQTALKVPQIGWNELDCGRPARRWPPGCRRRVAVYFVHSYVARPADDGIVAATTDYGGAGGGGGGARQRLGGTVPSREELGRRACACWPTSSTRPPGGRPA